MLVIPVGHLGRKVQFIIGNEEICPEKRIGMDLRSYFT